jgi:hypothetical protein
VDVAIRATGVIGAGITLFAFYLVTTKRVESQSGRYQGLNVVGGAILALYSGLLGGWEAVVLNLIWLSVAVRWLVTHR